MAGVMNALEMEFDCRGASAMGWWNRQPSGAEQLSRTETDELNDERR